MIDIHVQAGGCDCLYRTHKIFIFAVLERWLVYDYGADGGYLLLMNDYFVGGHLINTKCSHRHSV